MGCLIGAMTFLNRTLGEQSYWCGLWSRTSKCKDESYRLMVLLCQVQYLNGVLVTLKLMWQIKATQGITGLIGILAQI